MLEQARVRFEEVEVAVCDLDVDIKLSDPALEGLNSKSLGHQTESQEVDAIFAEIEQDEMDELWCAEEALCRSCCCFQFIVGTRPLVGMVCKMRR